MNSEDGVGSSPTAKSERPRSRIMDRKIRPSGFSVFSPGKRDHRVLYRERARPAPPPPPPSLSTATVTAPDSSESSSARVSEATTVPSPTADLAVPSSINSTGASQVTKAAPATPRNGKGGKLLNVRDLVRQLERSGGSSPGSSKDKTPTTTGRGAAGAAAPAAAKGESESESQGTRATMPLPPPRGRDGAAQACHRRCPLPPAVHPAGSRQPQAPPQQGNRLDGGFRRCYDDIAATQPLSESSLMSAVVTATPHKKAPTIETEANPLSSSPRGGQTPHRLPPLESPQTVSRRKEYFNNRPLARLLGRDDTDGNKKTADSMKAVIPQQQQKPQKQGGSSSSGLSKAKKSALDAFGISFGSKDGGDAATTLEVGVTKPEIANRGVTNDSLPKIDDDSGRRLDTQASHKDPPIKRDGAKTSSTRGPCRGPRDQEGVRRRDDSAPRAKPERQEKGSGGQPNSPCRIERQSTASYSSSIVSSPPPLPPQGVENSEDQGSRKARWRTSAESKAFWEGMRAALFISNDEMEDYSQQQEEARWLKAREAQERFFWQQQQQQQHQQQQQQTVASFAGNRSCAQCCSGAASEVGGDETGLAAFPTPPPITPWDPSTAAHPSAMIMPLRANFRRHKSVASAKSTEERVSELTAFMAGEDSDFESP